MADRLTPEQRSECMSRIHSKDTRPEVLLRKALWNAGFRYRKNVRSLPGTPDIVLASYRTAIFVNGCFWHGHEGCRLNVMPKTNSRFWKDKINRNRRRDIVTAACLEARGWNVITVWECSLYGKDFSRTLDEIKDSLAANKESWAALRAEKAEKRMKESEERKRLKMLKEERDKEIRKKFNIPESIARLAEKEAKE